jgi:hypothetical protein
MLTHKERLTAIIALLMKEDGLTTLSHYIRINNQNLMDAKPQIFDTLYLVHLMNQFQLDNGIKNKCCVNAQFLYRTLQNNYPTETSLKVLPVVAVYNRTENSVTINKGHMVVKINNLIFDPSYEVSSSRDLKYLYNMKDISTDESVKKCCDDFKRDVIKSWLDFQKFADLINNGRHIKGEEVYSKQLYDFIEPFFRK